MLDSVAEAVEKIIRGEREVMHLTEQQVSAYVNRTLGVSALLQADDHLTECPECCERLQSVLQANTGGTVAVNPVFLELTAKGEDFHLSFEQLSAFVEAQLDEVDREIITSHLADCANCLAEVEDLRAFQAELAKQLVFPPAFVPAPKWWESWKNFRAWPARWVLVPLTAALCVGAFGLALTWKLRQDQVAWQKTASLQDNKATSEREPARSSPTPVATPEQFVAPATPAERAMQLALTTGRVEVAPEIKNLRLRGASLMGAANEKTSFTIVAPQGIMVEATQPQLLWTPLPAAKSYVVTITDQNFKAVAQSAPLTQVGWTVPVKMERGRVYQWQVTATTEEGKEITTPLPSAPEAKFKVLAPEAVSLLQRVRPRYAGAHLELGIIYARVGLLDEAAREFRLEKARAPLARRLLNSLQQQRR